MRTKAMRMIGVVVFLAVGLISQAVCADNSLSTFNHLSAEADPHTGSATMAVPIDVPSGRAGIQPNVQLEYNSSLPTGIAGVGWALELGSIQRASKFGVPKYDDTDMFILRQPGAMQELVPAGPNEFKSKIEGAFARIERNNNVWTITEKNGTKYIFGLTANSRQNHPNGQTFKWCLERVEDINGNYMTFSYFQETGQIYPDTIEYTGNSLTNELPFIKVEFTLDGNSQTLVSYISGFRVETRKQIALIRAYINNQVVRRYSIEYSFSQASPVTHQLITRIINYGSDEVSFLPPLVFTYQDTETPTYSLTPSNDLAGSTTRKFFSADFNGDGKSDWGIYDTSSGAISVRLSTGSGFGPVTTWLSSAGANLQLVGGDFNGDGLADIGTYDRPTGTWKVALSNGSQFTSYQTWAIWGAGNFPSTGDFNGDGKTDILVFYIGGTQMLADIAYNTGNAFVDNSLTFVTVGDSTDIPFTADFNGDGLTDVGAFNKGSGNWRLTFNSGNLTSDFILFTLLTYGQNKDIVIADVNADGMADIGYWEPAERKIHYRASASGNIGNDRTVPVAFNLVNSVQVQSADFNGDAITDFMVSDTNAMADVAYGSGKTYDLLASVKNGLGGERQIEYVSALQFTNTFLPFPIPVVKKITMINGRGDSYVTQYEYGNGYWNAAEREFLGFGSVKVLDPQGNYSTTSFLQDDIFKGRPDEQASYDQAGHLFAKTKNTWNSQDLGGGVRFAFLKRTDNYVYDGDATGRRTAQEYFYEESPQLGNLTKTVQLGEVDLTTGADLGNDDRTVETVFTKNTSGSNWLHGLPKQMIVRDENNNIVRQNWFYYDNQSLDTAPVKGFLTKKENWAGTANAADNLIALYSYDGYGNLVSTTDPRQNVTTVSYDSGFHMFPISTVNVLGHTVSNEYYGINGVLLTDAQGFRGLWGQIKSTTDPNQQKGMRIYDVFGRLVKSVSPLDTPTYPTAENVYEVGSNFYKITRKNRIKSGQPATIDAVEYYDGLGRLIQSKAKTEVTGRYVISGQTEYDFRGLPARKYLPYFINTGFDQIDPIVTSQPHSDLTYDTQGRVIRTTNPDETYSNISYDDWKTSTIDENGHKQASSFDAYGRLIKKEEYTGADGRSPNYPAQSYALYATTLYTYDSEGNLIQTKDARNNIIAITYNKLGRKISMNDPDMGVWQYDYDKNDNLVYQVDAKNQQLNFTYDALNRLTRKWDGNGLNVDYTYDDDTLPNSKGRLTRAAYNGQGQTEFLYDQLGREVASQKDIGPNQFLIERGYDALDRLEFLKYPDQSGLIYEYNDAGQIEKVREATEQEIQQGGPLSFYRPTADKQQAIVKLLSTTPHLTSPTGGEELRSFIPAPLWGGLGRGAVKTFAKVGEILISAADFLLGVEPAYAQTTTLATLEAENMPIKTTGGSTTGGWNIWSNGYIAQDVSFPATGTYEFEIIARGSKASNVWPNMELRIDQVNKKSFTVSATSWTSYKVQIAVASGSHQVAVAFTNDLKTSTEDRNLYVDKVIIRQLSTGPSAPVLNAPTAGNQQVALSWNAVTGATGYKVYYGTASRTYSPPVTVTSGTSYTVTGLVNGTTYYFAVTTTSTTQESVYSNEVQAVPFLPLPATPMLSSALPGNAKVTLNWASVSGAVSYKIKYVTTTANSGTNYTADPNCVAAWKLEETTGLYLDACKANTGTVSGTIGRGKVGKYGNAVEFFGTAGGGNNAYVNFLSPVALDNLGARTITAWINPHNLGDASLGNILNKNYQDGWTIRLATGNRLQFTQAFSGGVVRWQTPTNSIQLNVWQHIAVTYTASGTTAVPVIYINGISQTVSLVASGPSGTRDNDSAYNLTMGIDGSSYEFDGLMDDVGVFSRVLSSAEINEIMNNRLDGGASVPGTVEQIQSVGNVSQYTLGGLTNGQAYTLSVAGVNTAGTGPYSNTLTVTPHAPAVVNYVTNVDYNAAGQIVKVQYGNGTVADYIYDDLTLRLKQMTTKNPQGNLIQNLSYIYDSAGNITSITDALHNDTQSYTYDALNRLTRAQGQYGIKDYAYDQIGNILQKDGLTYTYGTNGVRPHAVTSLSDGTTMTYDANGNMLTKVNSQQSSAYSYDAENRLVEVKRGGVTLEKYEYDGDGGRTKQTTYSSAGAFGTETCFLAGTMVTMADGSRKAIEAIQIGDEVLSYNETTMRLESVKVTHTFGEEQAREYLVINGKLQVTPNHQFYSQGDWLEARSLKLGAALLNQSLSDVAIETIEKVALDSPVTVYNIEVADNHNYFAGGVLVHNKLNFAELIGGTNDGSVEVVQFVGSLFETAFNRDTKHIFLGDKRIASATNGDVVFIHENHLGSANLITDSTGVLKELIEYEPYGKFARHEKYGTGEDVAWHYFTGQRLDSATGLYYFGARYYDPGLGRFIQADPTVQHVGDPQDLNRYTYARNNPVNLIDPTGYGWFSKLWKKVAAFVGVVVGTVVGIVAGPVAGIATYSAIAASGTSNFAQSFGANFASGLVGLGIGAGVGALWGGGYWSGLAASAIGGAGAGAVGSAILGGDPGLGALAGLAGGTIGYVGGRAWPLGADAVAGGVASVIQGGEFGEGAANGAYYNLAATAGSLLAPMPTLGQQDAQKGDAVYLKPEGPVSALISFFEGGVFSHTGTMVSKTEMVQSSWGDKGVKIVNINDPNVGYTRRGAYVSQRFRGNQQVVNQALTVANRQKISYGFLSGQKVCSTGNAYVYNRAGNSDWYGIGPNSQASGMGYSQFHVTRMYGE